MFFFLGKTMREKEGTHKEGEEERQCLQLNFSPHSDCGLKVICSVQ